MEGDKYRLCGNLKKYDCIELLKHNLSFEEIKILITPVFEAQLIKILCSFNKKDLQFIVLKNNKLTTEKIREKIKNSALNEINEDSFFCEEKNQQKIPPTEIIVEKINPIKKPIEKIIEKIKPIEIVEKIIEKPIEKIVEKIKPIEKQIEKIIEKPIEKLKPVEKQIEKMPVEKTIIFKNHGQENDKITPFKKMSFDDHNSEDEDENEITTKQKPKYRDYKYY